MPKTAIHHHPKTGLEGKFSLEHTISVALVDGEVQFPQFTDERVNAPDIQAFIPKIKYRVLPELGTVHDSNLPVTITIFLKNGQTVSLTENNPTGKPTNPMSPEQLQHKFESCTHTLTSEKRAQIVKLVSNLEKLDGIAKLMDLITQ